MSGERMSLPRFLAVLLAGALFGFGLALSTMVRPEVVLGFLRFEDFGLMLVMGGAVVVTLLAYTLAPRLLSRPSLAWAGVCAVYALARPSQAWARGTGLCCGHCVASRWAHWHRDCGRDRAAARPAHAHAQAKVSSKTPLARSSWRRAATSL